MFGRTLARPRGIYEGAFASRNPYASLVSALAVGPVDIAMGRFGWAEPDTGRVFNSQIANALLGVILPRFGLWSLVYCQHGVWYLRAGKPVTLAASGDFWVRFPYGANIGDPVYADPATGIAYSADGGGFQLTQWNVTTYTEPGCLGIISPYTKLG